MASINPTEVNCPYETWTSKHGYLRLTITSISDSDASTNKRYIGCKLTIEGTRWVGLYKWECTLGGQTVSSETRTVEDWYTGHVLATKSLTFDNDSAGNLTLTAYIRQLFFKGSYWWDTAGYTQSITQNLVCSQLPRYANFTTHKASDVGLNKITITWATDAACDYVQYKVGNGNWIDASSTSYSISNLTPNTTYSIQTRVRRTDSQLWTTSSALSVKTLALPTTNSPAAFNIGNKPTVSINTTSHLTNWYAHVYDGATKIAESGNITSTSAEIDLTSSTIVNGMLGRHTTVNSWNLTYKYYCVSNGITYTLTERTGACNIPTSSYLPVFNTNNISYVVTDSQSINITGSNKKVIKNVSDIRVTCTAASPQGSADMSSYSATSGTVNNSTSDISDIIIDLENVNGSSVVVQAIDSRNKSTSATKNYDMYIDYSPPTITTSSINRMDGVSANLNVNITGTYYNWSNLSTTNMITQQAIQYKLKSSSTWLTISNVNLTITNNNGVFTAEGIINGNLFEAVNQYDVRIIFNDKISTTTAYGDIRTGNALIWKDLTNNRVGIGKKPDKTLDVDGSISSSDLYINGTKMIWYE